MNTLGKTLITASFLLGLSLVSPVMAATASEPKCPICSMSANEKVKTRYSSKKGEKPVTFDSFVCAHVFHKRFPKAQLFAHDFESGEAIDATKAFYLVKSDKIAEKVGFAMSPIVVAFKDEKRATAIKKEVKDGKIVKGFKAVEDIYN